MLKAQTQQNSPRTADNSKVYATFDRQQAEKRKLNSSVDLIPYSISVRDMVKSNMRGTHSEFGIDSYQVPDTNYGKQRPRTNKFGTYKIPHFID